MSEAVKVAVRVRPFNDREKKLNAHLVISMEGQKTSIAHPETKEKKDFNFDYSYWSHDGFRERPDGYFEPEVPKYSDQKKVFQELGLGVLDNCWKGYNCSLFAYGQTGSGKSYSIVGFKTNKGVIPMTCEALFQEIDKKKKENPKNEYVVSCSMLEIYNEKVRDLLDKEGHKKEALKIREREDQFYADNLKSDPVQSYAEISQKLDLGAKNRTVAATNMNETSSRAHTVFAIKFIQKIVPKEGKPMTRESTINLVDLAGSERATATGATGERLKEGANINKSLSTLGNVINALADKKTSHVPYRDSVLTKLLKNALGGNSKTIMVAALSPADVNYDETLSTLRFAERAKTIKLTAIINETETDKLIRSLREENARLQAELQKILGGISATPGKPGVPNEALEKLQEMLKLSQQDMEKMDDTWKQKLEEAKKSNQQEADEQKKLDDQRKVTPHFWNLNEDPALNERIIHFFNTGNNRIGNDRDGNNPNIVLRGVKITKNHAEIENKNNEIIIKPGPDAVILVNGKQIEKPTVLHHNDRVQFAPNHLYVFYHPVEHNKNVKEKKPETKVTYDLTQQEILMNTGLVSADDKSKTDILLQEDLIEVLPKLNEANAIAEALGKKVIFEIALVAPAVMDGVNRTSVFVKMRDLKNNHEWLFDRNHFLERTYSMEDMYHEYLDGSQNHLNKPVEEDPFWESEETEVFIGSVHLFPQHVAYLMDYEEALPVTDHRGNQIGKLNFKLVPCDAQGKDLLDMCVEDPDELLGHEHRFKLIISNVRGLPNRFGKVRCQYRFFVEKEPTKSLEAAGPNADFNFTRVLTQQKATRQYIDYLKNEEVLVEVYGKQIQSVGSSKSSGGGKEVQQDNSKLASDLNFYKRKCARLETQVDAVKQLVNSLKAEKKETLTVADVEHAIGESNMKAAIQAVLIANKSRETNLGKASQACNIS